MRLRESRHPAIIPVGIIVSVLGAAFFVFLHLSDVNSGNAVIDNTNGQDVIISNFDSDGLPSPPPPDPPSRPRPEPVLPDAASFIPQLTGDEYITIQLDESDMYKGYLLLVNADNRYDIPDDLDLVSITQARTVPYRVRSSHIMLRISIMKPFDEMMEAFIDETGRNIMYIISAYRDYDAQRRVLNAAIAAGGMETALRSVKQPGFSEHHTGLAVDLATFVDGEQLAFDYFDSTRWFARNCYKYGFILRYARDKVDITGTIYEPWHFRYVGIPHSLIMHDRNWALEEYIEKIKEYTTDNPFETIYNGVSYEVFYSDNTQITIPAHASTQISGNNTDGFIVTIYNRYDRITNVSVE